MKFVIAICLCLVASTAWSQTPPPKAKETSPVPNPFHLTIEQNGMGGMEGEMGMGMGMGGMGGMMGMEATPSQDEIFRVNLPRAIQELKQSKTPEHRAALQKYIREAFEQRYDRMMADRKNDIERLRKSLTELESDLQRRGAAKDRVVQLQLQSVQLAAEGLLELNDLQGVERRGGGMTGGMGGGMGGGGMGGGGYQ